MPAHPVGFRQRVCNHDVLLGTWMQIGHPGIAEVLGRLGFDWVCVDLEHGAIDLETTTDLFRTLRGYGAAAVARLPVNDPVWIRRTLDAGAEALILPMIKTADEAEAAVRAAKYPPRGERGFGYSRANAHGIDFHDSIARANDAIALIMQIEHIDAIHHLDDILAVPDVDGVFLGPLDLSGSMGITGQLDHPRMRAALERYQSAARAHGVAAAAQLVRPDEASVQRSLADGYTLVALGLDNVFLHRGSEAALRAAGRGVPGASDPPAAEARRLADDHRDAA